MTEQSKEITLKAFRQIPGVGKSIANDLWKMGFRSLQELRDPGPRSHVR